MYSAMAAAYVIAARLERAATSSTPHCERSEAIQAFAAERF